MIPPVYPIVCLIACLAVLTPIVLAPYCKSFRRTWFVVASVIAILYAGDKPEPPPPPPGEDVRISLLETTASNVTLSVSATTNALGLAFMWQARRMTNLGTAMVWEPWSAVSAPSVISSTNLTETIVGRFVNGRRDTQIRMVYGDGNMTNEVTP